MLTIDLQAKKPWIEKVGKDLYEYIASLPQELRKNVNVSTGIAIYVREAGTRNSVRVYIHQPSDFAQELCIEKVVRAETRGDFSSQNSEAPQLMKFRGGLIIKTVFGVIEVGVSGLTGDEDTAVAAIIASGLTELSVKEVLDFVEANKGLLPDVFGQNDHYLHKLLHFAA